MNKYIFNYNFIIYNKQVLFTVGYIANVMTVWKTAFKTKCLSEYIREKRLKLPVNNYLILSYQDNVRFSH